MSQSHVEGPDATVTPPRRRARALALLAAVAVCVYGADQFVKLIVESTMVEGEVIKVLGPVLQWHFVRNPGAAFSFAAGQTWIFTGFAVIVTIVIAILARRIRSIAWATVFGLVLGGVLGNLTDRLLREPGFGVGHVVDYISTPWLLPAIYNIADMGIVFGMVLFVWLTIRDVRLDGTRGGKAKAAGDVDAPVTSDLPVIAGAPSAGARDAQQDDAPPQADDAPQADDEAGRDDGAGDDSPDAPETERTA